MNTPMAKPNHGYFKLTIKAQLDLRLTQISYLTNTDLQLTSTNTSNLLWRCSVKKSLVNFYNFKDTINMYLNPSRPTLWRPIVHSNTKNNNSPIFFFSVISCFIQRNFVISFYIISVVYLILLTSPKKKYYFCHYQQFYWSVYYAFGILRILAVFKLYILGLKLRVLLGWFQIIIFQIIIKFV